MELGDPGAREGFVVHSGGDPGNEPLDSRESLVQFAAERLPSGGAHAFQDRSQKFDGPNRDLHETPAGCLHRHWRGLQERGVQVAGQPRAPVGQDPLDPPGEGAGEGEEDRDTHSDEEGVEGGEAYRSGLQPRLLQDPEQEGQEDDGDDAGGEAWPEYSLPGQPVLQ